MAVVGSGKSNVVFSCREFELEKLRDPVADEPNGAWIDGKIAALGQ